MFLLPVALLSRVSSGFGTRTHPVTGQKGSFHNGIDFAAPNGTPVLAARAGRVVTVQSGHATNGNWIKIDHGNGYATAYLHLADTRVSTGSAVTAGQRIGSVGSTGRSTGNHLHFIVYQNGTPVDPKPFILWSGLAAAGGALVSTTAKVVTWSLWSAVIGVGVLGALVLLNRRRAREVPAVKANPRRKDYLRGGRADDHRITDFDEAELRRGTRVEREHTDHLDMAREIAMDHLAEDPRYYQKLAKWHKNPRRRK